MKASLELKVYRLKSVVDHLKDENKLLKKQLIEHLSMKERGPYVVREEYNRVCLERDQLKRQVFILGNEVDTANFMLGVAQSKIKIFPENNGAYK